MRIGLQTWGSEGDVRPFLALAAGLARAGHAVTLAITCGERIDYAPYGARDGFVVRAAGFIGRDEEELAAIARALFATANPLRQLRLLSERMLEPGVDGVLAAAQRLAAENDVLIGHHVLHPLRAAAEAAGRGTATVALSPGGIPTRHAPPTLWPHLGPRCNALAWRLGEALVNRILVPPANRLRRRLGLAPVRSYREIWESRECSLVAVSPALAPAPPDWAGKHEVCGFLRLEGATDGPADPALEAFLAAGPPPVYLTFGSMVSTVRSAAHVRDAARLLLGAARASGRRAVVQAPWDLVPNPDAGPDVHLVGPTPHLAVFPRCALVVHHGGAGTTQAATRCGRPSVVVPHVLDQYAWGAALRRHGIAPPPIDRRRATPESLGRAIRRVLEDRRFEERALRLGARLAAEDGVGAAVRAIERAFGRAPQGAR